LLIKEKKKKRKKKDVLVGKPEGKISLGTSICIWKDNIKIDFRDVGCGDYGLVWLTVGNVHSKR
jgi:hypothetical protein